MCWGAGPRRLGRPGDASPLFCGLAQPRRPETDGQRSGVGLWLPPPSSEPLGTPWRPFLWGVRGSGLAVPGRSAYSYTAEGEVNTGSPWQPAEPRLKVLVAREALVVSCS